MKLKISIFLCALSALMMTGSQAAVSHTEHADYVGTADSVSGRCTNSTTPVNIGKVCIDVRSTDKRVDISSVDSVLGEAGLWYYLRRDGQDLADGFLCGHSRHAVVIPAGTTRLDVYPLGSLGVEYCQIDGEETIGASTTGTITAKFYNL